MERKRIENSKRKKRVGFGQLSIKTEYNSNIINIGGTQEQYPLENKREGVPLVLSILHTYSSLQGYHTVDIHGGFVSKQQGPPLFKILTKCGWKMLVLPWAAYRK